MARILFALVLAFLGAVHISAETLLNALVPQVDDGMTDTSASVTVNAATVLAATQTHSIFLSTPNFGNDATPAPDETTSSSALHSKTLTSTETMTLTSTVHHNGTVTSTLHLNSTITSIVTTNAVGSSSSMATEMTTYTPLSTSTRVHTVIVTQQPVVSTTVQPGSNGALRVHKMSEPRFGCGIWIVWITIAYQFLG